MRGLILLIAASACTPEIVSGSYLCGPNASCPEGQVCSGGDHTCVLAGQAAPFDCQPQLATEPDDSAATAYVIENLGCVSLPFSVDSCMVGDDSADWVKFVAPSVCATVAVDARVTFPIAFQRLAVELRDLDRDELVATDSECTSSGEIGVELRCVRATLVPGTTYGLRVQPAGDGNCKGACAYNSYTLSVQLVTPR